MKRGEIAQTLLREALENGKASEEGIDADADTKDYPKVCPA